jgi:cell division protein FtsB
MRDPFRGTGVIEEDRDVMRDIGTRIQRYRLSRYAPPEDRVRRGLRWAWLVGALWLVWIGFLSEHNLLRLRQLSHERQRSEAGLQQLRREVARLDAQQRDPTAQRSLAEHALREKSGMAKPGEIIYQIRPGETEKR